MCIMNSILSSLKFRFSHAVTIEHVVSINKFHSNAEGYSNCNELLGMFTFVPTSSYAILIVLAITFINTLLSLCTVCIVSSVSLWDR